MNEETIEAIQASRYKAAFVLAGGGSSATQAILDHPGASRFVLDVQIPYSTEAMIDYLGYVPGSFCSEDTSKLLATKAYFIAKHKNPNNGVGIACTAAMATNRVRRGEDRAYVSIFTKEIKVCNRIDLKTEGRKNQEAELAQAIIDMLEGLLV